MATLVAGGAGGGAVAAGACPTGHELPDAAGLRVLWSQLIQLVTV